MICSEKTCRKCCLQLSSEAFHKWKISKDGLADWCKSCFRQHRLNNLDHYKKLSHERYIKNRERDKPKLEAYRKKNRWKAQIYKDEYYQQNREFLLKKFRDIKNTPRRRFSSSKHQAKTREIEWKINFNQFCAFANRACFYCGSPLDAIRLDRVDSNGIYEPNNVVPCCKTCNVMKSNLSVTKFKEHVTMVFNRFVSHGVLS